MKRNVSARVLVILIILAALAFGAWRLFPGEERKVRARIESLAAELSIPGGESGLARVTRAAGVRAFFTDDVAVELPEGTGPTIHGPEEIAGFVARASVPPEGTRVELLQVDIDMDGATKTAEARLNTRVVARAPKDRPPILDARMIALTLKKVEGRWLIANARVMPTDDSLGVR